MYNFSDFECSNEIIPHVIFKTTRSGFIQILHHSVMKDNSLYFLAETSYPFVKNSPSK